MKLIVQIPCLNEAETLSATLAQIPSRIAGIDQLELLVVDDGSVDGTSEIAKACGVQHVVRFLTHQGLARAFAAGIDTALKLGADIIVNTDADNQYPGDEIPRLIEPILKGEADVVIGDRQTSQLAHFSYLKKKLQKLGSKTVSLLSGTTIPDATSGFRAYSREAALRLNIFSKFSYTLESIIQAGKNQIAITYVPIHANGPTRRSRLFSNLTTYIKRSAATIIRSYALYEPLRTFFYIGGIAFLLGTAGVSRFLYFWFIGAGHGHIQSLVLSGVLLVIGFQVWMLGIIADLISVNRRLSEEILYRTKEQEISVRRSLNTSDNGSKSLPSPKNKERKAV